MKVLVTGGAGFIGSHVCDCFLKKGHQVVALDNLSTGARENLPPQVQLVVMDIRSREAAEWIAKEKPEVICHLAAQMDVRRSVADPRFDAEVNIIGLLNILESARQVAVRKFIFSSTGGAIYGEDDVLPTPENRPIHPISPYGVSKASGELYLNYYSVQYGLPYVALRYSNVYGPRQRPDGEAGVVAIFSKALAAGQGCQIFGRGEQTRDFVFVQDVARANYLAWEKDFVGQVNIGTGVETTVNRLYEVMAKLADFHSPPSYLPARPGEQLRSCIDCGLAKKALGWRPEVDIEQGLRQTMEFFDTFQR